jgi:hypothetical protein
MTLLTLVTKYYYYRLRVKQKALKQTFNCMREREHSYYQVSMLPEEIWR